ncbi:MAG: class II glutamine amidotransferase [Zavarzinella sp.]
MEGIQHECGIAALYQLPGGDVSKLIPGQNPNNVHRLIPRMLIDMQNRGQLAAGMTSYQPERIELLETYKEIGTVMEAFRLSRSDKMEKILNDHSGRAAIGHVRYATSGSDDNSRSYAQPFERKHGCKWKWFSFAFNGQLANFEHLRSELLKSADYHLVRDNDTEVIMHYISHQLGQVNDRPSLKEVFTRLSSLFDGAYNIVYLNALGDMVVMRDPKGIRPLSYAIDGNFFGAASENIALSNLGFQNIQVLEPGEMIVIEDGKLEKFRYAPKQASAHCFFEWVYFANAASTIDHKSVYLTRVALGKALAKQQLERNDVVIDEDTIVVPVPDTAAWCRRCHGTGIEHPLYGRIDEEPCGWPHLH